MQANRVESVWRGPGASVPRALFQSAGVGALYEFASAEGNLDGSGVVVVPGAAVQTARDRKSGRPDPLGVTSVQATAAARGLWGLTPAAGVRNLCVQSEFANGVADVATPSGAVASATMPGFAGAISVARDPVLTAVVYKQVPRIAGRSYTFSLFVTMDDGAGPPSFGSTTAASAANDFVLVCCSDIISPTSYVVSHIGAGVYRLSATNGTSITNLANFGVLKYSTNSARSFKVTGFQVEIATERTAYQRVAASNLDVVEDGTLRAGFWRSDLSNDVLPFALPSAVDGELFLIGRNGSWIEPRLASAGTAVAIGPTGTPATQGILRATGDIIAAGFIGRTLTADERSRLIRAYQGHGARGALIAGADAMVNGGFANATGWTNASTGTGTMTIAGGQCSLTGVDASNRGRVAAAATVPTVAGQAYLVEWTVVSGTANLQITVSGASTLLDLFGAASPGQRRAAFVADSAGVSLSLNVYSAGTVVIDNICLKPLTPGALL